MKCDEVFTVQYTQLQEHLSTADSLKQQDDAFRACRTRLTTQLHINLDAYTTYNDANDIHDLITALKVQQADIYGVSYGTRLALEVMRSFPQQVRSVILDSTVTPATNPNQDGGTAVSRVYRVLFDDCAAEPDCVKAHPNLEKRFWSFVAKAQKSPVVMKIQDSNTQRTYDKAVINGFAFAQTFWNMFYVTSFIPEIPKLMEEVMQGKNDTFAKVYAAFNFDQTVNYGMYNSVECNENATRSSRAQIEQDVQKIDASVRQDYALNLEDSAITLCQIWNVKPEPDKLEQPVQSSIPTLVMEGAYDPITPPSNGMEAAKTLSKSYQILAPATGHGVFLSSQVCPVQIGEAFLQTPGEAPNTACLKQMPARPPFA
jgi:pimeloyl-ACP methyl ester carboxylesterase